MNRVKYSAYLYVFNIICFSFDFIFNRGHIWLLKICSWFYIQVLCCSTFLAYTPCKGWETIWSSGDLILVMASRTNTNWIFLVSKGNCKQLSKRTEMKGLVWKSSQGCLWCLILRFTLIYSDMYIYTKSQVYFTALKLPWCLVTQNNDHFIWLHLYI